MYANVNFISRPRLVCENVVFSEPCCLESKGGVGKAFELFCKAINNFDYLKIEQMLPKNGSGLALL
jgi:hypothetical protein